MVKKRSPSPLDEASQIRLATQLIHLDARLQVLESETILSREKLIRLYKEIHKKSPPKGQLPFSTDWYMTWQANIHSSLFMNFYQTLIKTSDIDTPHALLRAFQLYREQLIVLDAEEVLSITRAWRLIQFFDSAMMTTVSCTRCAGHFVSHTYELKDRFVCCLCHMPSRAGKTKSRLASRSMLKELEQA